VTYDRRFRHPNIFVCATVIKQVALTASDHALNENHVRNLADFLPFLLGREDRLLAAIEQLARVVAVEDCDRSAVNQLVIAAVVDQHNAVGRQDRRWSRLDNAGVELSRTARQYRRLRRFGPVHEVGRVCQSHLVILIGSRTEKIHPVLAVDFLGHDRARLGPTGVPVALVGGHDDSLAFPMDEIVRSCKTELRVLGVVPRVGQVERIPEFHQPRIFYPTVLFVVGFGRQHRFGTAREMNAVGTFSVAKPRSAMRVLGAVEHHNFPVVHRYGGVECAGGLPAIVLRRQNGSLGSAAPRAKRQLKIGCQDQTTRDDHNKQRSEINSAADVPANVHALRIVDRITRLATRQSPPCRDSRLGISLFTIVLRPSQTNGCHFRLLSIWVLTAIIVLTVALPFEAQTSAANSAATKAYESGIAAIRAGDAVKAQSDLEKAVKLNPGSAEMQLALGQVMLQRGDYDSAITHLQTVIRLKPNLAAGHLALGQALSAKGALDEAIAQLREAAKLAPKDADPHRGLARTFSAQKKTPEALAEIKEAVALAPRSAEVHDELGAVLAQIGENAQAGQQFQIALQVDPKYQPAHFHLGVIRMSNGDLAGAQKELITASELNPKDGLAFYYLGDTYQTAGDRDAALAAYEQAAALLPDSAMVQRQLGLALQRTTEVEQAAAAFRKVTELTPNDPDAYNNLGLALMQQGAGAAAIKAFKEAIRLRPDDAGFRGNLGTIYLQLSDFEGAIGQLQQALIMAPNDASLHYDLGLALKLKDNLPAAITEMNKAIELDAKLVDPHYTLGIILWQQGEFPSSVEQLRKALELKPDYAEAYYTLGTVLKQMNQLPEAAQALREAIRLQPQFAGAHTTLAAVLRQMGDAAGAQAESQLGDVLVKQKIGLQAATFDTNSGKRMLDVGDLDGAISQFRNAIRASPSYAPAHYQLATALSRKGEKTEAAEEFKKAAELDPKLNPAP